MLGVPLLRGDAAIGVIVLARNVVRPFTDAEIERCHMDEAPVDNPRVPGAGADLRHAGDAYQATGLHPHAHSMLLEPRETQAGEQETGEPNSKTPVDLDDDWDIVPLDDDDDARESEPEAPHDPRQRDDDAGQEAAKSPTSAQTRARATPPGFGIEPGWQAFAGHLPPTADAHLARLAYWSGSVRAVELMLYLGSEATLSERQEAARHLLMEIATFSADIEDGGAA